MPNIRVDLSITPYDGQAVTFRSPANCSEVTGLIVYYPEGDTTSSKVFEFADAHGNSVGSVDLFASNVLVKVILDTELRRAYVQNADTNAYLEAQLATKAPAGYGLGSSGAWPSDLNKAIKGGFYCWSEDVPNSPVGMNWGSMLALHRETASASRTTQIGFDPAMSNHRGIAIRHCIDTNNNMDDTKWTYWEWFNPRMNLGVEYATIKRHKGKIVFVCAVDLGTLPNNTSKTVNLPYTPTEIVSVTGAFTDGTITHKFPSVNYADGRVTAVLQVRAQKAVSVKTFEDMSYYTGHAIVEYTKD